MSTVTFTLRSVTKSGKAIYELAGVSGSIAIRKSMLAGDAPKTLELAVPREVFAAEKPARAKRDSVPVEERAARAQARADKAAARAAKLAEAAARAKAGQPAPATPSAAAPAPSTAPQAEPAAARKGRKGK